MLPSSRWARVALLLLVLFALLRSVLWASVQPAWLAPDEDYHWLYINYMVEKGSVPSLDKPFYTAELFKAVSLTHQGTYLSAPRTDYSGSPKAILSHLGGPSSSREPAPPLARPVLHPPGFYLPAALIDKVLWSKDSVTRLTALRYYCAALGALTIFFAWLLAAQILAREWQQLSAAALASLQPILAFSASTLTNDVGVALTLTATLAWCAWMLRGPPRSKQGIGLGLLLGIALLVKATMLSLVIVIGATLIALWFTFRDHRAEIKRILGWTVGLAIAVAGWWYVRLVIDTHSILGERGSLTSAKGAHSVGITHLPTVAWSWITSVYRGYWFDYLTYEVRNQDLWFWLPAVGIVIVAVGFATFMARTRRTLLRPEGFELHSTLLIALAAVVLLVPPWALDTLRGLRGLPFNTQQGRFLTPAYPGLAVIAVIALRELTRRWPRAFPVSIGVFVAGAFVFYWHTWFVWVLQRFYGAINGHWLRALRHASYDKPAFITQNSLAVILVAAMLAFIAAYVLILVSSVKRSAPDAGVHGTGRERPFTGSPAATEVG